MRFRRYLPSLLLTVLPLLVSAVPDETDGYIVELTRSPLETPLLRNYPTRYIYDSEFFQGFSLNIDSTEAKQLEKHPDVRRLWPNLRRGRPMSALAPTEPLSVENNNDVAHMTKFLQASKEIGADGKGVNIGIIDSGVDYTHPALGGCFGSQGCKVMFGADLVGDNFNGTLESIQESNDPLDNCPSTSNATGHGTFVSGIIGADDKIYNWTGVAPGATLGMWRVYGCKTQRTPVDIILKAMEMASKEMDIINLSLGDGGGWQDDVLSSMADRLVAKGIHVIAAVGNSGRSGAFLAGAPSTGRDVIAVGSTMNPYTAEYILHIYDEFEGITRVPYRTYVQRPLALSTVVPIVTAVNDFNSSRSACQAGQPTADWKGATVLFRYPGDSGCNLRDKVSQAHAGGAVAVLVYTDVRTPVTPYETIISASLPVAFVNWDDGKRLFDAAQAGFKIQFTKAMIALKSSPELLNRVVYFSSLGPTNELQIKPELLAIGENVFSTLPRYRHNGYGIDSGTSMSAPYVSGSVALLLSKTNKELDPATVKAMLMNFARPVRSPVAGRAVGDNPIRQGAGIINVAHALQGHANFHVTPAKISFNDTIHRKQQDITIHNNGKTDLFVTLWHNPSLSVIAYDDGKAVEPAQLDANETSRAELSFSRSTLRIPAGQSESVTVRAQQPVDVKDHAIFGGYIVVQARQKLAATIPYVGMAGNMATLPVLDRSHDGPYPFPCIGNPDASILGDDSTGQFNLSRIQAPTILLRLTTGTPMLQFQVLQGDTDTVVGDVPIGHNTLNQRLPSRVFMLRNTRVSTDYTSTYYAWPWLGGYVDKDTTLSGTDGDQEPRRVPTGIYRIRVRALRVLGDRTQAGDWDEWTSPKLHMIMSS